MAFEKYKPNTRSSEPKVRLRKNNLSFNVPVTKLLQKEFEWDYVNIAVDKLKGQIALSQSVKNEDLMVIRNKRWGNAGIASSGIIKYFELERLIGFEFKIEDKNDILLLIPKNEYRKKPD